MATTLLSAVKSVLRRNQIIRSSDADTKITSLTVDQYQVEIDNAVDAVQETMRELYDLMECAPHETKEGTITLVAGQREYDFPSDFIAVANPIMVDQTDGRCLTEYPGGYKSMFNAQLEPSNYTGMPSRWAINPVTSKFRVDFEPTAEEAGTVFTFIYTAPVEVTTAAQEFPFSDYVTKDLIVAAGETFKEIYNAGEDYNSDRKWTALGRAAESHKHRDVQRRYA